MSTSEENADSEILRPFDLGNSIGHPILGSTMHQELKDAIVKVQDAAKQHNKKAGIYATGGDQAREFVDQEFHMVRYPYTPLLLSALIESLRYL